MGRYKAIKVNGKKVDEHRFIMERHIGRKLGFHECVHHKNHNPRDNRIENLEIMTRSKHTSAHLKKGIRDGTHKPPRWDRNTHKHSKAKVTKEQVLEIRRLLESGESAHEVADKFNVSVGLIKKIKYRQTWSWL